MDEELNSLQEVFERYRSIILSALSGVTISILIFLSWNYYSEYQNNKTTLASNLYLKIKTQESTTEDKKQSIKAWQQSLPTIDTAPKSLFPTFARLQIAALAFNEDEFDLATNSLKWVIENSPDNWFKWLGKIRLSKVYQQVSDFQQAKETLSGTFPDSLQELVNNELGNIEYQLKNYSAASDHWKQAELVSKDQQLSSFYQIKSSHALSKVSQ